MGGGGISIRGAGNKLPSFVFNLVDGGEKIDGLSNGRAFSGNRQSPHQNAPPSSSVAIRAPPSFSVTTSNPPNQASAHSNLHSKITKKRKTWSISFRLANDQGCNCVIEHILPIFCSNLVYNQIHVVRVTRSYPTLPPTIIILLLFYGYSQNFFFRN